MRPLYTPLISSLLSTPLYHESYPCRRFEWVSHVRTVPFRHAMVFVHRRQLRLFRHSSCFRCFIAQRTQSEASDQKKYTVITLPLPSPTITTAFPLCCRGDSKCELSPEFNHVTRMLQQIFWRFLWTLVPNKKDSGKWNATRDKSLAAMFIFVFFSPFNTRALAPSVPILRA